MTKLRIPVVRFADGYIEAHGVVNLNDADGTQTPLSDAKAIEQVLAGSASDPIAIWWIEVDVPDVAPRLHSIVDVPQYTYLPTSKTFQPGKGIPSPIDFEPSIPEAVDPNASHIYNDSSTMCLKCGIPKRDVRTLKPCKGEG